jgi:predicted acyl esterase
MDGKTNRWDWAEILLHWFDFYLKGIETDLGPAVQVQDSLMRWRNDVHYPPRDASWTTLHLNNGGLLADKAGASGSATLLPVAADPTGSMRAGGVGPANFFADFSYGKAESELKISGLPRVHVTVTPQGPGGYIGAFLYSKSPSGALTRIGWTSMNLRFAEGGDKPKEVVPGQPILAKMEIQPMEGVVPVGHELVLRVWINTPSDRMATLPPTAVTLNWGGSAKSTLEIPLIERADETYFQPPMPSK